MKYCSKCGNELMDEAVICPKCGCPVPDSEMNVVQDNRKVRLKSASAMNAIAFILNILCGAYLAWALFDVSNEPEPSGGISEDFSGGTPSVGWFWVWAAMVIVIFALGIAIYSNKTNAILPYVYILLSVLNLVVVNLAFPNLLYLVTCIWGIIFFVPNILQIIAGIRFLQSTK